MTASKVELFYSKLGKLLFLKKTSAEKIQYRQFKKDLFCFLNYDVLFSCRYALLFTEILTIVTILGMDREI